MTQAEIKAIKRYLALNGVKYYDVQEELIDHFATALEAQREQNPGIRFKVALLKAHRAFGGRKGFHDYIVEARKRVRDKILRVLSSTLLDFLGWPLFMITILVGAAWYFYLSTLPFGTSFMNHVLGMDLALVVALLYNYLKLRKSRFYLTRAFYDGLIYFFYLPLLMPSYLHAFHDLQISNHWTYLLYFSLLTLMFFAAFMLPARVSAKAENLYPAIS